MACNGQCNYNQLGNGSSLKELVAHPHSLNASRNSLLLIRGNAKKKKANKTHKTSSILGNKKKSTLKLLSTLWKFYQTNISRGRGELPLNQNIIGGVIVGIALEAWNKM